MNTFGVGLVVTATILAGCSGQSESESTEVGTPSASASPSESPSASPSESPSESPAPPDEITFEDVVTGPITNAEICNSYSEVIERYTAVVAKRTKSLKGRDSDPFKAANFADKNGWIYEDLTVSFEEAWQAATTEALNTVSNGQAGAVEGLEAYRDASLSACGLDEDFRKLVASVSAIDREQSSVASAAAEKPWYSKGYNPYGENLAWKWTEESCGYSSGYCWTVRVQTRDGCFGGLYAEMNIEKDGTVLGYTNDSLGSLGAGKTAKLEFTYYDRGAGTLTGSLTEIRCY